MRRKAELAWIVVFLISAVLPAHLAAQDTSSPAGRVAEGRLRQAGPPSDAAPKVPDKPPPARVVQDLVDGELVIQGNACIGEECGDNDADLPPVLRLKSMIPAILFEDVEDPEDLGGSFRNWALRANPGGVDQFSLTDVDGATNPLVVTGGAPESSLFIGSNGYVGLGTATPLFRTHIYENADNRAGLYVQNPNTGTGAGAILRGDSDTGSCQLIVHGSSRTISRFGQTLGGWSEFMQVSGNGLILGTLGSTPLILGTNSTNRLQIGAAGGVTVTGNFTATGTKSFAAVDPADSSQALYYAALEGPEAGTYVRGTARTSKGEAVIKLPDHFARLTEAERLTVQLTPIGRWGQLYVAEKSPSRLVVRLAPGSEDLEFDYVVQGVRKGYLDFQVKRPNTLPQ